MRVFMGGLAFALWLLLSAGTALASSLADAFDRGDYPAMIATGVSRDADLEQRGYLLWAAQLMGNTDLIAQVQQPFSDDLDTHGGGSQGAGLGQIALTELGFANFAVLSPDDQRALLSEADQTFERLARHPDATVAAIAALYRAAYAIYRDPAQSKSLYAQAISTHGETMSARRDLRILSATFNLLIHSDAPSAQATDRITARLPDLDAASGVYSPVSSAFLAVAVPRAVQMQDRELVEALVSRNLASLALIQDASQQFWQAVQLVENLSADAVFWASSPSAEPLLNTVIDGGSRVLDGATLHEVMRFRLRGLPAPVADVFLSALISNKAVVTENDPFFGRLAGQLATIKSDLGAALAAEEWRHRALRAGPSAEIVTLMDTLAGATAAEEFAGLATAWNEAAFNFDFAGQFALAERQHRLALSPQLENNNDRLLAVQLYAGLLKDLGRAKDADRAFAAYISHLDDTGADPAHVRLSNQMYQEFLLEIGKFNKAVSRDDAIAAADARAALQELEQMLVAGATARDLTVNWQVQLARLKAAGGTDDLRRLADLGAEKTRAAPQELLPIYMSVAIHGYALLDDIVPVRETLDRTLERVARDSLSDAVDTMAFRIDLDLAGWTDLASAVLSFERAARLAGQADRLSTWQGHCARIEPVFPKAYAALHCSDPFGGQSAQGAAYDAPIPEVYELAFSGAGTANVPLLKALLERIRAEMPDNPAAAGQVASAIASFADMADRDTRERYAREAVAAFEQAGVFDTDDFFVAAALLATTKSSLDTLERLRPRLEQAETNRPIVAWLDLLLAERMLGDPEQPLQAGVHYLNAAYGTAALWNTRTAAYVNPLTVSFILRKRLETAAAAEMRAAAGDIAAVTDRLMRLTRSGSGSFHNAALARALLYGAQSRPDDARALLAGLQASDDPGWLSVAELGQLQKTARQIEQRADQARAVLDDERVGGDWKGLQQTNAQLGRLGRAILDLVLVAPDARTKDLILWHAGLRKATNPEARVDAPRERWEEGAPTGLTLAHWAHAVALECNGFSRGVSASMSYFTDVAACAELARSLTEDALRAAHRATVYNPLTERLPSLFWITDHVGTSTDVLDDPVRFVVTMHAALDGLVGDAGLAVADQLAVEAVAERARADVDADLMRLAPQAVPLPGAGWLQSSLAEDEALVIFTAHTASVVTRTEVEHRALNLDLRQITRATGRLRSSLASRRLDTPVNVAAAHDLWTSLFAPLGALLDGKEHLWLQMPGVLEQIPFEALVTLPPQAQTWRPGDPTPAWANDRYSFALVPSLAAFATLRQTRPSAAERRFLGLGDPLLSADGQAPAAPIEAFMEGGAISADKLAMMQSLPDARLELEAVTKAVGVDKATLVVAEDFTASKLRDQNWAAYQTIMFATHGLSAARPRADSAIIVLSPGAGAKPYLSNLDIVRFDLDANLVVLAACDTGIVLDPARATGSTALATAFLSAGARGVIVSRWPLDSERSALMTVETLAHAARNGPGDTARVLRRLRQGLSQSDDAALSHPALWASLSVVGDVPPADPLPD